jgi:hypothetical protein
MKTPQTVTQLIEGSGNSFHSKVARWFDANKWHVVVSPYYMDQSQSKARELDLVVEKAWPITDDWHRVVGHVAVRLFVECKFIASEAVFWFSQKNTAAAKELVCGFPPFRADNTYTNKHHYLAHSPKVAKLFTSNNSKAQENDPFYKALNQSLSATIAMKGNSPGFTDQYGKKWRSNVVSLEYPVIVCSSFSQMYAVDFLSDPDPSLLKENFQLEVQYAFHDRHGRQRDEYFLIDVVEFDQLAGLETVITEGVLAAAFLASS